MRIKGIPGHERCTDAGCEAGVMEFSCLSTDKVYTAASASDVTIVYDAFTPEHEDNLGIDSIKQAQKRILEKAIGRLEDLLDIARRGLGPESYDYDHGMNIALERAIGELKSLMGEV